MKKFVINKDHSFVVQVASEFNIKFGSEWISVDEEQDDLKCFAGKVVFEGGGWPVGKESKAWVFETFEDHSGYVVEINKEDEMWSVFDLFENTEYYGGFMLLGDEKNFRIEIEWDCDVPDNKYEMIEELIKNQI